MCDCVYDDPVVCLLLSTKRGGGVWLDCDISAFFFFKLAATRSLRFAGIWKISLYRQVTWYDYRWKGGELFASCERVDLVKIDISVTEFQRSYAEKYSLPKKISNCKYFTRFAQAGKKNYIAVYSCKIRASTERGRFQAPIKDDTVHL